MRGLSLESSFPASTPPRDHSIASLPSLVLSILTFRDRCTWVLMLAALLHLWPQQQESRRYPYFSSLLGHLGPPRYPQRRSAQSPLSSNSCIAPGWDLRSVGMYFLPLIRHIVLYSNWRYLGCSRTAASTTRPRILAFEETEMRTSWELRGDQLHHNSSLQIPSPQYH